MTSSVHRRTRPLAIAAAVSALVLALSGCAPEPAPSPSPVSTEDLYPADASAESSVSLFFGMLAAADVDTGAFSVPGANPDLENPLSMLMTPEVYSQIENRPIIQSVDEVTVSQDAKDATATVTYELDGEDHTDTFDLRLITENEGKPDDYALVLPKDTFGLDAAGVELLPADTEYRIHGVDVSAAFSEARGWATDGTVPRVPAFGGTYPLEITVPGDNGFTATLELQTSTFFGGDGTDGQLTEFAHAHGF